MSQRDSGDDTQTIIIPSPGGRRRQGGGGGGVAASPLPYEPEEIKADLRAGSLSGANPLVLNASSLLSLVDELRNLPTHDAVGDLQERLVGEIAEFHKRSMKMGFSDREVKIASYFICSLIDETVMNTPWGNHSNWGQSSLLVRFHNEAWGGEKFFHILEQLMQRSSQYLNLLEFAYLCLSLGFEGQYRTMERGARSLEQLRHEVYILIMRMRGEAERDLSINWRGLRDLRNPLTKYVPLWLQALITLALLVLVYLGFAYLLSRNSDLVFADLMKLAQEEGRKRPMLVYQEPAEPPDLWVLLIGKLQGDLDPEVKQGMVQVLEGPIVRVLNSFPSGSDQMLDKYRPMLLKLVNLIKDENYMVEVIGHTDNKPIFSARFPSNWDLSNARAKNVMDAMVAAGLSASRISSKGMADTDPVATNDTAEGRAMNRRVDIHIR